MLGGGAHRRALPYYQSEELKINHYSALKSDPKSSHLRDEMLRYDLNYYLLFYYRLKIVTTKPFILTQKKIEIVLNETFKPELLRIFCIILRFEHFVVVSRRQVMYISFKYNSRIINIVDPVINEVLGDVVADAGARDGREHAGGVLAAHLRPVRHRPL